jgi:ArsR family transcriptional regulator, arsenate/arsenite/antimonite-responsive transcriptional repressor
MEMETAIKALAALAQETRLRIFRALVRAHDPQPDAGGLAAGDIAKALSVTPATLSFHLKELTHAGLVTSRRDGRSIVYRADLATMQALAGFLLEDCCQGACGTVSRAPTASRVRNR